MKDNPGIFIGAEPGSREFWKLAVLCEESL